MEEESWRRNHGGGIMEETSLMRNHGGGIMEEASGGGSPGSSLGTGGSPGSSLGTLWGSLEAGVALGWPGAAWNQKVLFFMVFYEV